jgi:uncharacterized repeat protein (TIGR03803 family)
MKSSGWFRIVLILTLALSFTPFLLRANDFQKQVPNLSITTPSNGVVGTSFSLTANTGGSTGIVTWSVVGVSGTAEIIDFNLHLQQAGTVRISAAIAEDATHAAFTVYKLIAIRANNNAEDPAMAQIWGTTSYGGAGDAGVLFRMNADGTGYTIMNEFVADLGGTGAYYSHPISSADGNLYGTLSTGGLHGGGVLYKYSPDDDVFTVLYHFKNETGSSPVDIIEASNGVLYGATNIGGVNDYGVLFQFNKATNVYTVIKDFDLLSTGTSPYSAPHEGPNSNLVGTTQNGGPGDSGALYEYNFDTEEFTVVYGFTYANGILPYFSPQLASNNKFYGITALGGNNGQGTIYEYDTDTKDVTIKYHSTANDLNFNYAGFSAPTPEGNMYTISSSGGSSFSGSVIEYNFNTNSVNVVAEFSGLQGGSTSTPLLASDGKIYGVRSSNLLWKYDPATEDFDIAFQFPDGGPSSPLTEINGIFYGATNGSDGNGGWLYSFDRSENDYNVLKTFYYTQDGSTPRGYLATDGKDIFLTTNGGGSQNAGVFVDFDKATNVAKKIADFDPEVTGYNHNGFITHSNKKMYGIASSGGETGTGVINVYDPNTKVLTTIYNFTGYTAGGIAASSGTVFKEGKDGLLYAIANGGDGNDLIIVLDPVTNGVSIAYTFQPDDGGNHYGFTMTPDGKLWGVGRSGGTSNRGIIFNYNPAEQEFNVVYNFTTDESIGVTPQTIPALASNGKLYGTAYSGGTSYLGLIYEFDPANNTYAKKIAFTDPGYSQPLIKGVSGKLIGYTTRGGDNNWGYIYEYDPATNDLAIKTSFGFDTGYKSPGSWLLVKRNIEMTFNVADKTFGDLPFEVDATSDFESDITYTALSDNITIDDNEVTIVKAGRATIKAEQQGDDNYDDAIQETSFCINPAKPVITVAGITLTSSAAGGNQWYKNGDPVTNATSKTYQVSESGSYVVKSTIEGCSSAPSELQAITISGLEDDLENLVKIYPNPTSNELFVNLPAGRSSMEVSLIDHLGRAIESRTAQPHTTEKFEVGQLPPSVYIVKVVNDGKMISKVFVKR